MELLPHRYQKSDILLTSSVEARFSVHFIRFRESCKYQIYLFFRQLKECSENLAVPGNLNNKHNELEGGIRLFGNSTNYVSSETSPILEKRKRRRKHIFNKEENENNEEKCKLVAVSADWITSGKAIEGWQNSTRGEVVVVNKSGEVIEHKKMKKKIKTNSWGVRNDSFHIDVKESSSQSREVTDKKEKIKEKRKKRKEKKKLQKLTNESVLN